jgi:hypothetical protein
VAQEGRLSHRPEHASSVGNLRRWYNDQEAQQLPNGARRPFTGTPVQIADDIKRYEEVGVRHIMLSMAVRRPDVTVQQSLERRECPAPKVMLLV